MKWGGQNVDTPKACKGQVGWRCKNEGGGGEGEREQEEAHAHTLGWQTGYINLRQMVDVAASTHTKAAKK